MMIVREFREAWRRLTRRPGYALLSVAVLGVGLGVVLFLFSLINTLVLSPLPFPHAQRLVAVGEAHASGIGIGDLNYDEYRTLRHGLTGVSAVGAYLPVGAGLDTGSGATHYKGTEMTSSMMGLLGVEPILGRGFTAADDKLGAPRVMVIDATMWRHVFHGDPDVIGRKVRVSGHWTTIVGVLPKRFAFRGNSRFWLPLRIGAKPAHEVYMVARRKPGVTLARARAELAVLNTQLHQRSPAWQHEERVVMKPLAYVLVHKDIRRWVWLMFAASVLVLLLACVNVGNLQLVQTLNRRRELALRSALGCGRMRLFGGVLAESLLLSVAALAVALPIVYFGNRWLVDMYVAHGQTPNQWENFGIHGWVWAFAAAMAVFSTGLAGVVSAWRASRAQLGDALRDGGKGSGGGFARVAKTLVVVEIALTVVLLVGAGTFVQALDSLLAEPAVGASHKTHILTARVNLPSATYANGAKRIDYFDKLVTTLRREPGVMNATASNTIPGAMLGSHEHVSRPGRAKPSTGWPWVQMGIVGPHFLATYGVRLVAGRFFDARDTAKSQRVIVIDQRMAHALWPHGSALHQKLVLYPGKSYAHTVTVVGIVRTLQLDSQLGTAMPAMLMPLHQAAYQTPLAAVGIAVRTRTDAAGFASRLTGAVHAVNPEVSVYALRTQAQVMAVQRIGMTVLTDVFSALGLVALLLAGAGLYGVLSFSVAQRTQELGIRRAIGASSGAIARTVGGTLAWQLGLGLAVGLIVAVPWSGLLADPGMRTQAHDPAVFIPVLLVVIGVSVVAALVPLLHALRVAPAEALRHE